MIHMQSFENGCSDIRRFFWKSKITTLYPNVLRTTTVSKNTVRSIGKCPETITRRNRHGREKTRSRIFGAFSDRNSRTPDIPPESRACPLHGDEIACVKHTVARVHRTYASVVQSGGLEKIIFFFFFCSRTLPSVIFRGSPWFHGAPITNTTRAGDISYTRRIYADDFAHVLHVTWEFALVVYGRQQWLC